MGEFLVQGEADGLDGNVGGAGGLQEGSEDAGWNVTTTSDGNHEMRLEVIKDLLPSLLTKFVDLVIGYVESLHHPGNVFVW